MATLSPNATQDEIEEELSFTDVLIESLDQGADDFATRLAELEGKKHKLEQRLEALLRRSQPSISSSSQSQNRVGGGMDSAARPGWSQYPTGNNHTNYNGISSFDGGGDMPHTGTKRSATDSLRLESQYPAKRPTPEPSNIHTPASSVESFDVFDNSVAAINERARRRQAAAESEARKRMARQYADEQYARGLMGQSNGSSSSSATPGPSNPYAFSQRPTVQTTLNHNGSYQRLPPVPPSLTQQQSTSYQQPGLSTSQIQDLLSLQAMRTLPTPNALRQQAQSPYVKQETNYSRPQAPQSGRRAEVVDLTASDSDEDVAEILPNGFTPNGRPQRSAFGNASSPSFNSPLAVRTAQRPPSAYPPTASIQNLPMPGSFPTSNSNGYQSVYGNGYGGNSQQPTWLQQANARVPGMVNGIRNVAGQLGNSAAELGQLLLGRNAITPYQSAFDDDDDEILFAGSRRLPHAGYADVDLFNRRYNELAEYNPEKTKEEISALLENIRPDEDIPADLRVKTPEEMSIKLHKYQELGLTWLKKCEEGSNRGGVLADEMGLGKTIQMLSLIVTRKSDDPRCKTTLIIAPVALMRQWKQEIEQKIKSRYRLSVFIQHGASKKKSFRELQMYDIVLTTYGTLASEIKKLEAFHLRKKTDPAARPNPKEQCALLGDDAIWYRIILDEAQCIKNRNTRTHTAACYLNAKYRFAVTGTPMMNNVQEFFSLIKFLRINPYCRWEKFRLDISTPLEKSHMEEARESAMAKLQALCKAVMLRRTKQSTFEGQPILVLPERTTEMDYPVFDEDEKAFYDAVETKTTLQFNKYWRAGTVGNNYSAVLVLLLRLRQAACHPHLVKDFGIAAAADISEDAVLEFAKQLDEPVVARIKATGGNFECPVCYDVVENPAIYIPCGHDTCRECFSRITDPSNALREGQENGALSARCPNCRGPIEAKRVTDFEAFKKVHMPELLSEEERAELEAKNDDDEDSETESEDDSESDDEDEVDAKGNLLGFVDDSDKEDSETESEAEEVNSVEDDGGASSSTKKSKGKAKQKVAASKGKSNGKGKGKKRKKKAKKDVAVTLADLAKLSQRNAKARKAYLRRLRDNYMDSAKIRKTMELLQQIIDDAEGEKVLIFSQWTSLLDLLEIPIDGKGWNYRRYDGSMNTKMRADAVDDFRDTQKGVRIMLVSLKAGNAGLNLNMASQVIILDPFWNPYIEEQAIDRAHRIGQNRPVKVHRILVEGTVEDKIIALQERKRALISQALDEKAGQNLARLGVQELAFLFGVTRDPGQRVNYRPANAR